jgi:hypothetical protein
VLATAPALTQQKTKETVSTVNSPLTRIISELPTIYNIGWYLNWCCQPATNKYMILAGISIGVDEEEGGEGK